MAKKQQHNWKNVPHFDALKDRIPATTLLKLHQLKEQLVKSTTR